MTALVAVDLGAESGRVVRGRIGESGIELEEVARFPNGPVLRDGHLRWEWPRLLSSIEDGLAAAADAGPLDGIGVDGWGVDFGLLGADGHLLEWPVAYRDARTDGVMERMLSRLPAETIYGRTGIQFLPFNTLYQLAALAESGDPSLGRARRLQMVPDLVLRHLAGFDGIERTNASTTQCVHLAADAWDRDLLAEIGVDPGLLPARIDPGTVVGPLREDLAARIGLGAVPAIAPATHDTASAVVAVPGDGEDWAYVSSGTWSLVGVETEAPVATEAARRANLTNEGGVEGTTRLLRNVMGLWLVQRCRAEIAPDLDYGSLTRLAEAAPAFVSVVDVDDRRFLNPSSMPEALREACRETGEPVPDGPGPLVRCALESLALGTRAVLSDLRRVTGRIIRRLHVVGGGSRNALLCRMTAGATGLPVIAGPVEATALGNVLVQAIALGHLGSRHEARALVRRSLSPTTFEPEDEERWEEARERLATKGRDR